MPFFQGGGGDSFPSSNKTKQNKKLKKKKQTKTNKEGLGPSEVALRATSPHP